MIGIQYIVIEIQGRKLSQYIHYFMSPQSLYCICNPLGSRYSLNIKELSTTVTDLETRKLVFFDAGVVCDSR